MTLIQNFRFTYAYTHKQTSPYLYMGIPGRSASPGQGRQHLASKALLLLDISDLPRQLLSRGALPTTAQHNDEKLQAAMPNKQKHLQYNSNSSLSSRSEDRLTDNQSATLAACRYIGQERNPLHIDDGRMMVGMMGSMSPSCRPSPVRQHRRWR
jgi:hypothetical protein